MTMTFTILNAQLADYLHRDDLTSQIPDFIRLAEIEIGRVLRVQGVERYALTTMTVGDYLLSKPTNIVDVFTVQIKVSGAWQPLRLQSLDFVQAFAATPATQGVPKYFAHKGEDFFMVAPAPNAAYELEIGYYERSAYLTTENETNWLTENAFDLLLYGSLVKATPFIRFDERIPMWRDYYDRALAQLTGETYQRRDEQKMEERRRPMDA